MASINEKLNYINETKSLIKDKLNNLGSEIDNETTFREYVEKIENLYEEWPKISDENTIITLNNTKKGKMNLQLKGNTSQEGTPTPETPQDIHVVSGDNEIVVCGKNLANINDFNVSNYPDYKDIYVQPNQQYTLQWAKTRIATYTNQYVYNFRIIEFYNGDLLISSLNGDSAPPLTENETRTWTKVLTTPDNCNKIRIDFSNNNGDTTTSIKVSNVMFERGNITSPTFEPYQGNTYPVNLPVENLWHLDNATNNGVTLTNNDDGSITLNGTCTSTNQFRTMFDIPLSSDTYTLSFVSSVALSTGSLYVRTRNSNGVLAQNLDVKVTSANQTVTSDIKYLDITIINGVTYNNVNLKIQLEKGSKANSFTPYGTTPIELCKIGDYQDSIKKSTGKNLIPTQVDKWEQGSISVSGNVSSTTRIRTIDYYPIKNDTNYYISIQNTNYCYLNVYLYNSNKQYIEQYYTYDTSINGTTSKVINIPSTFVQNVAYMRVIIRRSDNTSTITANEITTIRPMINEGSTALPYEPYGTGWYVKKEIGKTVITSFDSATDWNYDNIMYNTTVISDILKPPIGNVRIDTLSNYFESKSANQIYANNITGIGVNITGTLSCGFTLSSTLTTLELANTWVASNNITAYYPLATPTYTKITDSTLISQLNALAKSYTSQTNISQESNDLASLLNATANVNVQQDLNVNVQSDLSEYFVSEITHNTTNNNNYKFLMKKNGPIYVSNDVTNLKNCFEGIIIETLDVSQMNMSNIGNVNSMFSGTSAKEIIGLNNWNTSNISNFGSMFYGSTWITKLDLSSFTLGNRETYLMGLMFSNTYKLAVLDISNMELNKATSFSSMFSNCGSQCLQSDGAYADGIPYIYVKDTTSQNWVLTQNNGHPSTWTTDNVVVKSN